MFDIDKMGGGGGGFIKGVEGIKDGGYDMDYIWDKLIGRGRWGDKKIVR